MVIQKDKHYRSEFYSLSGEILFVSHKPFPECKQDFEQKPIPEGRYLMRSLEGLNWSRQVVVKE